MSAQRPEKEPLEYKHLLWAVLGLAVVAGVVYVLVQAFFFRT